MALCNTQEQQQNLLFKNSYGLLHRGGLVVAIPQISLEIAMIDAGGTTIRTVALVMSAAFFEELLKIVAGKTYKIPQNTFAVIALFGIYELALSKPLIMLWENDVGINSVSEALLPIPALFFHTLTAAIYAFPRPPQPLLKFTLCFGLHTFMNMLVFWEVRDWLLVLLAVPLGGMTLAIWRCRRSKAESSREQVID